MDMEYSCGAVVFTRESGEPRYLIITLCNGDRGFPKGHMEGDETEEETALREIAEETGVHPRLLPGFRMVDEYALPGKPGVRKRVTYFLGEFSGEKICCQPEEVRSAALLTYAQARNALTFEMGRKVLDAAKARLEESMK